MATKTRFVFFKRALLSQSVLIKAHFELTKASCYQANIVVSWSLPCFMGIKTTMLNILETVPFIILCTWLTSSLFESKHSKARFAAQSVPCKAVIKRL